MNIADTLGTAQLSMSRNGSALSKVHRLRKPGLDLVRANEDPLERRRKLTTSTSKGRILRDEILGLLQTDQRGS